jgi:hypothetical protein
MTLEGTELLLGEFAATKNAKVSVLRNRTLVHSLHNSIHFSVEHMYRGSEYLASLAGVKQ